MSKFNFDDAAIKVLANFAAFNQQMAIAPDRLSVHSANKAVLGSYKFDTPYTFEEFYVYDANDFLAFYNALKKPSIEVKDKCIIMTNDAEQKLTYYTAVKEITPISPPFDNVFDGVDTLLDFSLPADKLAIITKMTSLINTTNVFFETKGKKILITVGEELESSANNFEVVIEDGIKQNQATEPIKLSVDNLKILAGEYTVKFGSKTNKTKVKHFSTWSNLNGANYMIFGNMVK